MKSNERKTLNRSTLGSYHETWAEFWTEERCFITELLNDSGMGSVSLAIARVEPGVTTQLHALAGVTERYVVIAGVGWLEVGGARVIQVATGRAYEIGAGETQRIWNDGNEDLIFYCLCTPRFEVDCYQDLETGQNVEPICVGDGGGRDG